MTFSYDPPDASSLRDLMDIALDGLELEDGGAPATAAAAHLHQKLMLHGERHHLEADDESRTVVLRMHPTTASWLACLITDTNGKIKPPLLVREAAEPDASG